MQEPLLKAVLEGYGLPWDGVHGLRHWARVLENGRRLTEVTRADLEVVELFALLHDCRRVNEGTDPGHGQRSGEFARRLLDSGLIRISRDQFDLLHHACVHHTDGLVDADVTVQTCWDSDRLDLGRVWVTPKPHLLCTPAARERTVIEWAESRSRGDHHSDLVDTWLSLGGRL